MNNLINFSYFYFFLFMDIDDFEIIDCIHSSRFCSLFLANYKEGEEEGEENQFVVLKESRDDEWTLLMAEQEIKSLQLLSDIEKGIPKYIGSFRKMKKITIVYNYIPGSSLKSLQVNMKSSGYSFSFSLLFDIIEQILFILSSIHEKGVIHFDIKPENIIISNIIDNFVDVSLIDFGISKIHNFDYFDDRDAPGTNFYMSPESKRGRIFCDKTVDIFSIGMILKEYLNYYINLDSFIEKYYYIVDEYLEFIVKSIQSNPLKRFQSIDEMLECFNSMKKQMIEHL